MLDGKTESATSMECRLIDPLLPAACSRGSINRGRGNAMNKQEHNVHNDTKDLPMESHIGLGQVVEIGDF